jgi:pimeloyl-ACP methyl ester carboxylesterase
MARHLPVRRVLLIASCRHPAAVTRPLRAAERISRPWPTALYRPFLPLAPLLVGRGGAVPPDGRRLLGRMAREVPLDLIRWGARALLEWPGARDPAMPVSHIHGERDWVIPVRNVSPDRVVPGGSHVLNLSHPREVNEFIGACLN